jgi:hypothetical protein
LLFYNGYDSWWNSNDYQTGGGTAAPNQVVTHQYSALGSTTAGLRSIFVNSTTTTSYTQSPFAIRQQTSGNNAIGGNPVQTIWPGNFQMYNFYVFNTAIDNGTNHADRQLIEATPYTFTAVPNTITLTITSVTATNFVLSTSTVTGANQFVVFVNGSATYISATGLTALSNVTLTPNTPGPWALNVYAYNSGYSLLAGGTVASYVAYNTSTIYNYRADYIGMNDAGNKKVFGCWNNASPLFYYSSYNGTTWSTPVSFGTATTSNYNSVVLTADGTRGVVGGQFFTWSGSTPTGLTTIGSSNTSAMMSADGSRLVQYNGSNYIVYTWGGSSYTSSVTVSLTNLTSSSIPFAMSPDGNRIFYFSSSPITNLYFATWNGTNFANETLNVSSAWSNYIAQYPPTGIRTMYIGYQNTIFVNVWSSVSSASEVIALAYNSTSGYYDKFFVTVQEPYGGYTSGVAVPRLLTNGTILYSANGTVFTGSIFLN